MFLDLPPGTPPFARHVRVYRTHGHTVLELHGEIDIAAGMEVVFPLDAATAPARPRVVVDLSPVTFLDCSGIRLLCRARRRVVLRQGSFGLVCPQPRILQLLDLVCLTDVLCPQLTLEQALSSDPAPDSERA